MSSGCACRLKDSAAPGHSGLGDLHVDCKPAFRGATNQESLYASTETNKSYLSDTRSDHLFDRNFAGRLRHVTAHRSRLAGGH